MSEEELNQPEPVEVEAVEPVEGATPEPADPPKNWSSEEEQEARMLGWKPRDEWRGEVPPGYMDDPTEYLSRAERLTPFRKLKEQMEAKDREAEERLRKLEAMNDQALQRQRAQYESQLQQIKAAQAQAVKDGNVAQFQNLEQQRGQIEQQLQQPQQPQGDPYVSQYAASEAGAWVNNPTLRQAGVDAINANPAMLHRTAQEQIAYAEQEVRRLYPHAFQKEEPKPAPVQRQRVDGGGLASAGRDKFSQLPQEAKSAFQRFVKEGLFKDDKAGREEFANEYAGA